MSERRKNKKKKDIDPKDLDKKPTKEEYAIAKYLKQKLPEKKTTLLGHKVEYFIASKAVDCLLESSWAKSSKKGEIHFNNRDAAVSYMARMLDYKLFHRAKKIIVQKEIKKKKKDEDDVESGKEKESKKSKGKSEASEKKDEKEGKKESEAAEKKKEKKMESEAAEKKKEKKKIKLDMHLEQIFIDANEPYVWIYDPISIRTWITGTLMVIAAVLICLFPLWPQFIRHYIYYLSVAAAFFLVFIIGLAIFRLIFFVLVWIITLGKHHIWLLPNLTEDVGFFESFWPLYKYEYKGKVKDSDKDKESKDKTHKEEEDDSKKEDESQEKEAEKSDGSSSDQDRRTDQNQTESEESGDDKQKGDNENGFEIIEAEDANESKSEDDEKEEDRKTK